MVVYSQHVNPRQNGAPRDPCGLLLQGRILPVPRNVLQVRRNMFRNLQTPLHHEAALRVDVHRLSTGSTEGLWDLHVGA